jgi:hypothetical protein
MRNKSTAARLIKRKSEKCISGIVRSYSKLQDKFAQMLDDDESILEYRVNVDIGKIPHFDYLYTTDFVVKKKDGSLHAYEVVQRKHLKKNLTAELLDFSRNFWAKRQVTFGIITDAKK